MQYNFDEIIERRGTDAYKYVYLKDLCGREDVLPMWVADMDFATPPFVMDAIQKKLSQRVLGYQCSGERYRNAIVNWNSSHHGWNIKPEDINYVPGVVAGIYLAMQTFTEKQDKILIQDPVYHPFHIVPEGSGRTVVWNRLETWNMNLETLEHDIHGCRMMILCNPHNPGGVCWTKETLQQVAHICHKEGVIVVSDEIHCDMVLGGRKHIPFASVSDEARDIAITLQAPSKTFNMPGIVGAQAIVQNPELRDKYFSYIEHSDMDLGNSFCYEAAVACYSEEGDEWRNQMLQYVEGNIDALIKGLEPISDKIKVVRPEASFLVLLDCRGLGFKTQKEITRFFADECHLALNPGEMFGSQGRGYMRINMGCPRSTVLDAVNRITDATQRHALC